MSGTVLVATASQGILRSADNGRSWHRTALKQAIEFDATVRSLAASPDDPAVVYAGADAGLVRSLDGGNSWSRVDSPFNDETVWKIAVDPRDPRRMFAGTGAPSRAALWRSLDRGNSWYRVPTDIPAHCAGVSKPRLLAFAFDPNNNSNVWFGLEEGGLFQSTNGGDTFERVDKRLLWDFSSDVHAVHVLADARSTVVVISVNAIYVSRDGGETFDGILPKKEFQLYYARALASPMGSDKSLLVSISDGTPGTTSKILASDDAAATWRPVELPAPDSCVWAISFDPSNARRVVAGTKYGTLMTSTDGGAHWERHWRSFPEITDVLWIPVTTQISAAHKSDIA